VARKFLVLRWLVRDEQQRGQAGEWHGDKWHDQAV
jgi:hypothetical protein